MGYTGTTNYGFQKPEKSNSFNVDDLNNALDSIDDVIKANETSQNNKNTEQDNRLTSVENKNSSQDTAIDGKLNISQGVENSGKVLAVGEDGNVIPKVFVSGVVQTNNVGFSLAEDTYGDSVDIEAISVYASRSSTSPNFYELTNVNITNSASSLYYDKNNNVFIKTIEGKINNIEHSSTPIRIPKYAIVLEDSNSEYLDSLTNSFSFLIGKTMRIPIGTAGNGDIIMKINDTEFIGVYPEYTESIKDENDSEILYVKVSGLKPHFDLYITKKSSSFFTLSKKTYNIKYNHTSFPINLNKVPDYYKKIIDL